MSEKKRGNEEQLSSLIEADFEEMESRPHPGAGAILWAWVCILAFLALICFFLFRR